MTLSLRIRTLAILAVASATVSSLQVISIGAEPSIASAVACSDGIDNDSDGAKDFPNDGGCEAALDENEGPGIYADRDPKNHPETIFPPITISVTDGREFAEPQEVLHYDITVSNPTNIDRAIALRAMIPAELTLEAATDNPVIDARSILWPEVLVAAGESQTFGLAARIAGGTPDLQPIRVRAYAGEALGTDTTSIYRGVVPAAFGITASDGIGMAVPGEELDYTIVISNQETKLATEVDVHAALPQYTEFVAADEGGSWTGKSIYWTGLTVSPKGERTLHVRLRIRSDAPLGTSIQFVASTKGHQGIDRTDIGTESDTKPKEVRGSQVVLRKSADRTEVRPGETVRYTVYLRNTTGGDIRNVRIEDRLDQRYMRMVSADAGALQGDRIVWTLPLLAAGQSWEAIYTVSIAENTPHGETLQNVVSVSGEGMEDISLTQRVITNHINVVRRMPPTGAPLLDLIFLTMSALAAAAPVALRRKAF